MSSPINQIKPLDLTYLSPIPPQKKTFLGKVWALFDHLRHALKLQCLKIMRAVGLIDKTKCLTIREVVLGNKTTRGLTFRATLLNSKTDSLLKEIGTFKFNEKKAKKSFETLNKKIQELETTENTKNEIKKLQAYIPSKGAERQCFDQCLKETETSSSNTHLQLHKNLISEKIIPYFSALTEDLPAISIENMEEHLKFIEKHSQFFHPDFIQKVRSFSKEYSETCIPPAGEKVACLSSALEELKQSGGTDPVMAKGDSLAPARVAFGFYKVVVDFYTQYQKAYDLVHKLKSDVPPENTCTLDQLKIFIDSAKTTNDEMDKLISCAEAVTKRKALLPVRADKWKLQQ